jgi:hypothetical protein
MMLKVVPSSQVQDIMFNEKHETVVHAWTIFKKDEIVAHMGIFELMGRLIYAVARLVCRRNPHEGLEKEKPSLLYSVGKLLSGLRW